MFMMTTVLVLLQTTIWSMFLRIQGNISLAAEIIVEIHLGKMWTELMCTSPPAAPPKDLKVFWHSVVLVLHTC